MQSHRRESQSWSRTDTIVVIVVVLVGGVLRFFDLGDPSALVFDEVHYSKDACLYATSSHNLCGIESEANAVHPPLGKWMMAGGIKLFGYDSFGRRVAAAVAGTITIALVYVLARRLLHSTLGAGFGAGLLAVDFLHFVQSRMAMLDVFLTLFGVATVLFLVLDRDHAFAHSGSRRPWRVAAGAAAGAAAATKWPGAAFILIALVLSIAWEARAARERGDRVIRAVATEGPSLALSLVLLPAVVYALSYVGRLDGDVIALPWTSGSWWRAFYDRQVYMFQALFGIEATHPYQSPAWTWMLVKRPVSYFYESAPDGRVTEIMALGNPIVWWTSIPALLYMARRWLTVRDPLRAEGVILAGVVLTYGPWLLQQSDRTATFIFYLLPTVPFMCLALAYVAVEIGSSMEARAAIVAFTVLTVSSFAFFYPVLANVPLSQGAWEARIRFNSCSTDPPVVETKSIVETRRKATIVRTSLTTTTPSPPTEGWCWI